MVLDEGRPFRVRRGRAPGRVLASPAVPAAPTRRRPVGQLGRAGRRGGFGQGFGRGVVAPPLPLGLEPDLAVVLDLDEVEGKAGRVDLDRGRLRQGRGELDGIERRSLLSLDRVDDHELPDPLGQVETIPEPVVAGEPSGDDAVAEDLALGLLAEGVGSFIVGLEPLGLGLPRDKKPHKGRGRQAFERSRGESCRRLSG